LIVSAAPGGADTIEPEAPGIADAVGAAAPLGSKPGAVKVRV
jgi:hypothetical protein